jgi:heat shock protein HslJ
MPDDPENPAPPTGDDPGAGNPGGFMVYVAVVLIAILILLVVFMNVSGQGTTAATAITENAWQLQSMAGQDGTLAPVQNGTVITASFSIDGKLTGSGGCNSYSGRYMVRETRMVVSRVISTSLACWDNNATLQESRYFSAIENAAALRVHDRVLTLYGTDGSTLLVFNPAPVGN